MEIVVAGKDKITLTGKDPDNSPKQEIKREKRDACVSCIWNAGLFVFVLLSPLDVTSGGDFFIA